MSSASKPQASDTPDSLQDASIRSDDEDYSDLSGEAWPEQPNAQQKAADEDTVVKVRAWAPPLPPPPEGIEVPMESDALSETYCNDDYCIDLSGAASGPALFDEASSISDESAASSALAEAEQLLKLLKTQGGILKK